MTNDRQQTKRHKEDYPMTLSIKDIQEILGCGINKVNTLIHSEGFPAFQSRKNTKIFIHRDAFFDWYEGSVQQGIYKNYFVVKHTTDWQRLTVLFYPVNIQ